MIAYIPSIDEWYFEYWKSNAQKQRRMIVSHKTLSANSTFTFNKYTEFPSMQTTENVHFKQNFTDFFSNIITSFNYNLFIVNNHIIWWWNQQYRHTIFPNLNSQADQLEFMLDEAHTFIILKM